MWPLDELDEVVAAARELGLAVHLDGTRLLHAAVAQGVPPARIAAQFDTVTICLSKGLGCLLGALLAGTAEQIQRAWREKHLFGGAMRQAGIVAAAGVYALDHHMERLAEDHAARGAWPRPGRLKGCPSRSSRWRPISSSSTWRRSASPATRRLQLHEAGVGLSSTVHPTLLRAVTHLDLTDEDIDRACELVLTLSVPASAPDELDRC